MLFLRCFAVFVPVLLCSTSGVIAQPTFYDLNVQVTTDGAHFRPDGFRSIDAAQGVVTDTLNALEQPAFAASISTVFHNASLLLRTIVVTTSGRWMQHVSSNISLKLTVPDGVEYVLLEWRDVTPNEGDPYTYKYYPGVSGIEFSSANTSANSFPMGMGDSHFIGIAVVMLDGTRFPAEDVSLADAWQITVEYDSEAPYPSRHISVSWNGLTATVNYIPSASSDVRCVDWYVGGALQPHCYPNTGKIVHTFPYDGRWVFGVGSSDYATNRSGIDRFVDQTIETLSPGAVPPEPDLQATVVEGVFYEGFYYVNDRNQVTLRMVVPPQSKVIAEFGDATPNPGDFNVHEFVNDSDMEQTMFHTWTPASAVGEWGLPFAIDPTDPHSRRTIGYYLRYAPGIGYPADGGAWSVELQYTLNPPAPPSTVSVGGGFASKVALVLVLGMIGVITEIRKRS